MEDSCALAAAAVACIDERQDSIQTAGKAGPASTVRMTVSPARSASGPACSAGPGLS